MLSKLASEIGGKTLVLQHRDELVNQNMAKFLKVNPDWRASVFNAKTKSFSGDAVFAMQQSLVNNLDYMPTFDHVIIDESHHSVAPTYAKIIEACQSKNKKLMLTGFTATPERGDKKSLRRFFNNVADQITIKELVGLGFLVPPVAMTVDVGVTNKLAGLGKQSGFGDQTDVANVLDTRPINDEVVRHWKEQAFGRKTVVFCSTVQHAEDVCAAFRGAGINSFCVHGQMPLTERRSILEQFDKGSIQVITNVAVLTEGFDSQPVSCVILLRLCSDKGPMIQMVGRGLRTVDPQVYPDVVKKDCIVLDFGTSLLTHGNLDVGDGLFEEKEKDGTKKDNIVKTCPAEYEPGMVYKYPDKNGNTGCGIELPAQTRTCPICGYVFERLDGADPLTRVDLTEIDLLNASPFRWVDLFETDTCLIASGFNAWAGIFSPDSGETWIALGQEKESKNISKLAVTGRLQAMAMADDFLRNYETDKASRKSKRWLDEPATDKQLEILSRFGYNIQKDIMGNSVFTKYSAACVSTFWFNKQKIEQALGVG